MKPTAGNAKPRRATAPPTPRARLNLQRRPKPDSSEDLDDRHSQALWKWVVWIALAHVLVILGASLYYLLAPAPKPPDQFITLLPPGDVVHGSPGAQQAHKVGATQQAAPHKAAAPPPPASSHVTPPQPPKPPTPPPVVKPPPPTPTPSAVAPAPVKPKPAKPVKPKPETPKVNVDLHEVDRPDATDTPAKPAKHHSKKPVKTPDDSQDDNDSSRDTQGLSKQQIAEKLGDKLEPAGSHNAQKYGASGQANGHANDFQDFYAMIRDQVRDAWNSPMTPAQTEPVVGIHVETDGRVPAESVHLIRSSGDPAYDQAALDTVKRLGFLHEPLPHGCPPDITIRFNPNISQ